jgi:outer membrane biosynthesis protein TonB
MGDKDTYLRCTLVWERAVMDERVFAPASKVTVGESPKNTFVLQAPGLNNKHCLFHHTSSGTVLYLLPGMLGKVRIAGRVREAAEMANDSVAEREGDAYRYALAEGDEGVLVFGRVGLAFTLIKDLGRTPTAGVGQVMGADPFTGKLFGIVGALILLTVFVSRLLAGTPPDYTVEQLPERMVSFVVDDPEAQREFQEEMKRIREEKKEEAKKKKEAPRKVAKRTTTERDKIRKKVADKGMVGAIAKARKKKGALQDVLGKGGLGMSLNSAVRNLDRGMAHARVLTSTGAGGIELTTLVGRRGTSEAEGEGLDEELPGTGRTGRRAARESRLAERREAEVRVSMPASAATVTGGVLSKKQISDVIMRNKGAIRYCYESQLMRYPTLRGKVTVDFIIDTSGRVLKVKVPTNTLTQKAAKDKVGRCLIKFISRWRFPKPKGGKVRVIYPFTFGRSR